MSDATDGGMPNAQLTGTSSLGTPASDTITVHDLELVTRQRDKAVQGGGTWQSWDRILRMLAMVRALQGGGYG